MDCVCAQVCMSIGSIADWLPRYVGTSWTRCQCCYAIKLAINHFSICKFSDPKPLVKHIYIFFPCTDDP